MKKEEFLTSEEEKVFNRGVSAGYFDIDIEYLEESAKKEIIYKKGLEYGREKLQKKQTEKRLDDGYKSAKIGYLKSLITWIKDGVVKYDEEKVKSYEEFLELISEEDKVKGPVKVK